MPSHTPPRLLLSIDETAELLGVRRTLVNGLLYTGALPSITIGRRRLVAPDDLVAFIERRRSADTAIAANAQ
jgi:excisionase family DNA binding protein